MHNWNLHRFAKNLIHNGLVLSEFYRWISTSQRFFFDIYDLAIRIATDSSFTWLNQHPYFIFVCSEEERELISLRNQADAIFLENEKEKQNITGEENKVSLLFFQMRVSNAKAPDRTRLLVN